MEAFIENCKKRTPAYADGELIQISSNSKKLYHRLYRINGVEQSDKKCDIFIGI